MSEELEQAKSDYLKSAKVDYAEAVLFNAESYIEILEHEVEKLEAALDFALQLHHDAKQEIAEVRKEVDSYTVARVEELEKELETTNAHLVASRFVLSSHAEVCKHDEPTLLGKISELEKSQVKKVYIAYDDGTLVGVFKSVSDAQGACTSFATIKSAEYGLNREVTSLTPWKQEVESHEYPIERNIKSGAFNWEQWIDEHTVEENF